ncbi:MAG: hypothetical protein MRY57_02180 [Candidatus Pacebacteria bacterium]|nr:hypothetical protein [Candidatus Paceibacterota bacterium]
MDNLQELKEAFAEIFNVDIDVLDSEALETFESKVRYVYDSKFAQKHLDNEDFQDLENLLESIEELKPTLMPSEGRRFENYASLLEM